MMQMVAFGIFEEHRDENIPGPNIPNIASGLVKHPEHYA
jgi:hypothetical protein